MVTSPATATGVPTSTIRHTVYGPFATDTVLTDDLDLTSAPVLTDADDAGTERGLQDSGYTDEDQIVPTEPGYYVIVTTFEGDDRVQPYASSPADVLERFYVPTHRHRGARDGDHAGDTGSTRR